MFMRNFGHPAFLRGPMVIYSGAPDGGGGGGGGTPPAEPPAPTPPAEPPASPLPWTKPDEAWKLGDKAWYDHLPDGPTKDLVKAKAYANPQQLADAYFSANKMISQNGQDIIVPKDDAPPEAWNEYHKKIGRPDKPEAYPDFKMPDGVQADPNMLKLGKDMAFKLGLPPKGAQQLADMWNEFATQQNSTALAAQKTQNDTDIAALQTKYGEKWDSGVAAGRRAVEALKADGLLDKLEAHIGAASVLDLFMRLGMQSGEGGVIGDKTGGNAEDTASMTPQAAAAEIERLKSDATFSEKYFNAQAEGHDAAVKRMLALMEKAGSLAG